MQATLLTYRFGAKYSSSLRMIAMKLGIRVKVIEKWQYLEPIGSFTGDCGSFESLYDGEDFKEPMLVMAHFSKVQFDGFLAQLKASRVPPVPLKCVLTETNAGWDSLRLHENLVAEQEAVKKGMRLHEQAEEKTE